MRAGQGLALSYAELGLKEDAQQALEAAKALDRTTPGSAEAARHLILEARVADGLGDPATAAGLLASALTDLLAARAGYDAAIAALELAQLYAAQRRTAEVDRLLAQVVPLSEAGALPDRARSVLFFALHRAALPGRDSTELLAEAGEYLERARERPWLRFRVASPTHTEVFWDLLPPEPRRDLCERAGLPPETANLSAAELPTMEKDLLTWTYELLAGVRMAFESLHEA
jgi:tetratricopeptide (TPR) repeat protein